MTSHMTSELSVNNAYFGKYFVTIVQLSFLRQYSKFFPSTRNADLLAERNKVSTEPRRL